ncbi:cyclase [Pseudolabrys sp. Root1462]|jgi:coenzyme Q-binding protein COQ10|uniref:type II toxin-antitoxin system RatA family toxin n=1 Tax=Pseudolabrys sp. Root1462 TaxID=1736466 RepID=UPI000703A7A7|nr:type II toxin-antitoxin system RatA family toxin [Pseudolabrys sp. Root1462]KQZ01037.1 cyclase [Pseudolabrys sp. Root1462]
MPQFTNKRRVRHAAADMFDLVADVEKYPQFVPLCDGLRVKSRTEKGEGVIVLVAAMTVAYKMIRQTFLSRVTLDKPNLKIVVEYLDGPFSRLQNRWSFVPTGDNSCEVEFYIDYEFRSRTFGMLMGAVFDTVFRKMAAAFEERADKVYGTGNRGA